MNAFRFPLQKVLELREETERESAKDLADARRDADDARRARVDLETVRQASQSRLAAAHGVGGAVGHLQNLTYVVGKVEQQIHEAEVVCQVADEHVVERMKSYHEAHVRRKTIDQLREKKLEQWRTDLARHEQKIMDEVAVTRHGREATLIQSEQK
jgi:flagellar protein FliJ